MKKTLLFLVSCVMTALAWAADATFGFESTQELTDNFTYTCEYSNATMTIATDVKQSGNSSLKAYMGGSGGKSNFLYTKQSYQNITQIKLYLASSDKGKTSFGIAVSPKADFSSDVTEIQSLAVFNTLPGISSPSNSKPYEITYTLPNAISGYIRFTFNQPSSSGKYLWMDDLTISYQAGPSSDATLKALTVDGSTIPGFSPTMYSYNVEMPANYTGVPTVAATATDSKADVKVTQATALPGTAIVNVTAEDGTTKKEYKVTITKESSAPKVESATWDNITAAGATVDNVKMNITGKIKNGTGLTAITPSFTGKNITSWTPNTPQDFSKGAVDYTLTSATGETTVYHVTITEADPISDDATLKSLTVAGCTLKPTFSPTTTSYQVEVAGADVPKTTAVANHAAAKVVVTDATSVAGVTKVVVTAEDGVTTKEYQITFKTVVPPSGLTAHVPDIYDQPKEAGGYNTNLVVFNNREYEVYYSGRDNEDNMSIATKNEDRIGGICAAGNSETSCKAKDNWFEMTTSSVSSCSAAAVDEFAGTSGREHRMIANNGSYKMLIKGFDQFSLYGKDKKYDPAKPTAWNIFEVYIDGIKQEMTPNASAYTIRRFDISSDEHLIEVKAIGGSTCAVVGFSLRVGTDPRVRYVMGNDSSQSILQTRKMSPVTYIVKNNIDTKVVWTFGTPATGIDLVKHGHSGVSDTLMLEGVANCPVGTYTYRIVAYDASGNEKSTIEKGSFSVRSQLNAVTDTIVNAYEGWSMDAIEYTYYALDANQIHLNWTSGTPAGVTGAGQDGTYSISGTPTAQGTYPFIISIDGGNTLTGKLIVKHLDLGTDPILYVYKGTIEKDGIFDYLESKNSVMAATQSSVTNMTADQMNKFKVIVIGESTDATNEGAKKLISYSTIPVLNMQAFAYNPSRLNWGYAANGSAVTAKMKVIQPTHPIFKKMGLKAEQEIDLLDSVEVKGLVATEIFHEGSWCLSTTAMRGEDYMTDGAQQTFLHEVSAAEHGSKYLCLPIAKASSNHLTTQGKRLIDECIAYLKDNGASPIALPKLQITSFSINGVNGVIDEANKTIVVTINKEDDYSAVQPAITLADPTTFVTPASGEAADFSDSFIAHPYVVCDYINKVTYNVTLKHPTDLDEVYVPGEWVNIYDMHGFKVMTTNEDVHALTLPRGVYVIQTESHSFRIFR